jgi:hypothetical protein
VGDEFKVSRRPIAPGRRNREIKRVVKTVVNKAASKVIKENNKNRELNQIAKAKQVRVKKAQANLAHLQVPPRLKNRLINQARLHKVKVKDNKLQISQDNQLKESFNEQEERKTIALQRVLKRPWILR